MAINQDQELLALQGHVETTREAASDAVARRDRYVAHLLAQGRSVRSLAFSLGITRQQVMRIRDLHSPARDRIDSDPLFEVSQVGGSLD